MSETYFSVEGTKMANPHEYLKGVLKAQAVKLGEFTLASGKKSDFYFNCKQAFLRPENYTLFGHALYQRVTHFPMDSPIVGVAGEGVGGVPLVMIVSTFSYLVGGKLQPLIVRKAQKDHGTRQKVEYVSEKVPVGSEVVLLEDVLTTGGSALKAVQALRDANLLVRRVVAVVDRQEGA